MASQTQLPQFDAASKVSLCHLGWTESLIVAQKELEDFIEQEFVPVLFVRFSNNN